MSFYCPPGSQNAATTPPTPRVYSYTKPVTYSFDYSVSFSVPDTVSIEYRPDPRKPPRRFEIAQRRFINQTTTDLGNLNFNSLSSLFDSKLSKTSVVQEKTTAP
jgi:hypothetical protein